MKNNNLIHLFTILFLTSIIFSVANWSVDGFDFFEFQHNNKYFQSWISIAGVLFSLIISITVSIIYKKTKILSLRFIPIAFILTAIAYATIGYHLSYCKVCSNLTLCGASHNYSDFFIIIALVIFTLLSILQNQIDIKIKTSALKILSYGLISAIIILTLVLFFSLQFIEIPNIITYRGSFNLQGIVFIIPLVLSIWFFIYFKNSYKSIKNITILFILLIAGFIPQTYHILFCNECNIMECSEFFVLSGLIMLIVVMILIYSININLKAKV